jgi:hypothetical protein
MAGSGPLEGECRVVRAGYREALGRSYVIFLLWSESALVIELRIEDLSGYRHRKTAI